MHKLIPASLLILLATASPLIAKVKEKPQVTMAAAKATALKRVAGRIKSAELETEKGKLVYSFDIVTADKKIMEVLIDAMTGDVIEVEEETPEHEHEEERQDRKKRQGAAKH